VLTAVVVLALVVPLAVMWWSSRVPSTYSVMDMGVVDYGGGPVHAGHLPEVSVADLIGPQSGEPDVEVTLTARQESFTLPTGEEVDGYTLNGTSPGPEIRADVGDLVQVTLVNDNVDDGATLHWHGVDVPNAEDGVAGVTQDAVPPGGRKVYRFVAEDAGTYWYHSHQVSHRQVRQGLFGSFVVAGPEDGPDAPAVVHSYDGRPTVNGRTGTVPVSATAGEHRRVRITNTDNVPLLAWVTGASFRVVAVDGRELEAGTEIDDRFLRVAGGGRVDLDLVVPVDGARVEFGEGSALQMGPARPPAPQPEEALDLLTYGTADRVDLGTPDRTFEYKIDRRPGFVDGRPGFHWSINGKLFPDVPAFHVSEGDVVLMRIENHSGSVHPMHLHGHHALVLSRNGVAATGSPWWTDSLDVDDGETYEFVFVADNPGIWMDHCHNLTHAQQGLIAHLMYEGVTTPYLVGGDAHNSPE
jgi:FtsP/CotA-like multicopper oxidase with cupredoxin domain